MPGYTWDPIKAERNFRKHGVSFDEAETALDDPARLERVDIGHSISELRIETIGRSRSGRLLTVITSQPAGGSPRIITARRATKRERDAFERRRR